MDNSVASGNLDSNITASAIIENGPHVLHVPVERISELAPFSALILSIIFVFYFLIRFYILEGFLLRKVYGKTYTNMDDITRRGFVNHHIAGTTKILILIVAAYPFIDCAFGRSTFDSPFAGSKLVTQGDVLLVVAQMLMAMYVFELLYRPKISPVSVGHHVGTIMIGQSAIAISLNLARERDATIEFILCTVWGAFDIVSEFLPHVSIILYRVHPTSHQFLRKLFRMAAITTFTGTIAETVLTMYLFGVLWKRWTIAFKLATPMLHILFMAAQLHGSWCLYQMHRKQCGIIAKKENTMGEDLEAGPKEEQHSSKSGGCAEVASQRGTSQDEPEIEMSEHAAL